MAQLVERVLGKDEVTGSIPVSSSKLDRVEPKKIGFLLGLFFVVNQVRFGVADRRFTVDDGALEQWKQISYCAPRHGDAIADFCI